MPEQPRFLLLGEILRPHGIHGELKIRVLTDYPERITDLETVYVSDDPNDKDAPSYSVEHMRPQNAYGLLKLRGVQTREQAETLRQLYIMVALEDAVPLEDGEFFIYQLIGLSVQTVEGDHLGTLTDVLETGANAVYVVDSADYGEVLIPAIANTIVQTDLDSQIMIVKLPEGTLPHR
jgi:16S rRNA processing protein RimM